MSSDAIDMTPDYDPRYSPRDDLYRHVNGKWLDEAKIPDDRSLYGSFTVLRDRSLARVREILEEAAATRQSFDSLGNEFASADEIDSAESGVDKNSNEYIRSQIGVLYDLFMNTEELEELGLTPLADMLDRVESIDSLEDLFTAMGWLGSQGVSGAFELFIWPDPFNPERNLAYFAQGGLGLPDEKYYTEEHFAEIREKYQEYLQRVFEILGGDPAEAQQVYALESKLAGSHWDAVDCRNADLTNNLRSWDELKGYLTENLDASKQEELRDRPDLLDLWRESLGLPEELVQEVIVRQPSFFAGLGELLHEESISAWRSWLRVQVFNTFASLLNAEADSTFFNFYRGVLSGLTTQPPRWERGVDFVNGIMGQAVGKLYVQKHFSQASKARMDRMVSNLLLAYRESIISLDWMTEATKEKALEKLDKFSVKVGYPQKWRDYSAFRLQGDLVGNARAGAEFELLRAIEKLSQPVDRSEWYMTPQTVNAYYNPAANEIVFPAAILQPPFFNPDGDEVENYGAIGAIIGHEIGHGFDDQGSKYDGDGNLRNWWSQEDREAFQLRGDKLVKQYSALSPDYADGVKVNGELTLGENIGDLGGLAIAWKAYLLSQNYSSTADISREQAQRFFIAWGLIWRLAIRPEEAIKYLTSDPHSPNQYRCNQIARNLSEYYWAFEVDEGSEMWLPEDERVLIW